MSSYLVVRQNPIQAILGMAGVSIDVLCTDEQAKKYVATLWKYYCQVQHLIHEKENAIAIAAYDEMVSVFKENQRDYPQFSYPLKPLQMESGVFNLDKIDKLKC